MTTTGEVQITVLDGGASIVTPANSVQLVIGFASLGTATAGQLIATTQPSSLQTSLGYGALPEAAALSVLAGGVVLAVPLAKAATGTAETVQVGAGNTVSSPSVVTVTLDATNGAFDDYYVFMKIVTGGVKGTSGWTMQISLDAGRTFGPVILPGTAATYVISNTGITLNFAAGNFTAGDTFKFATTGPSISTANIQTALNTFAASQYAIAGIGSIHIVGSTIATVGTQQGMSGANATTIQGYLDTLATGFVFTRAIISARDSNQPTAYGGAGETDVTWTAAIALDYSAVSAKRICACAGYYNMPSAYPNASAGTPRYRRPLAWALAARQVTIPPQRHAGRVRDGALSQIVVDPSNDPKDGFNYHDERVSPGLDAARFTSARTRFGKQGYFIVNPNLMSPSGSDFTILPRGNVMDVACDIVHQAGEEEINDDVRLNPSGTLYINDALTIQNGIQGALTANMLATSEISGSTVVVDQTANVGATSKVPINVTIQGRGYVLEEDITIGFQNGNAAA
jgi:hypothetical protein